MEIADEDTLERMGDVNNVSETAERSGKVCGCWSRIMNV